MKKKKRIRLAKSSKIVGLSKSRINLQEIYNMKKKKIAHDKSSQLEGNISYEENKKNRTCKIQLTRTKYTIVILKACYLKFSIYYNETRVGCYYWF